MLVVLFQSNFETCDIVWFSISFGWRFVFMVLDSEDSSVEYSMEDVSKIVRPMEKEFMEKIGHYVES